jgi:hypothetical protein
MDYTDVNSRCNFFEFLFAKNARYFLTIKSCTMAGIDLTTIALPTKTMPLDHAAIPGAS